MPSYQQRPAWAALALELLASDSGSTEVPPLGSDRSSARSPAKRRRQLVEASKHLQPGPTPYDGRKMTDPRASSYHGHNSSDPGLFGYEGKVTADGTPLSELPDIRHQSPQLEPYLLPFQRVIYVRDPLPVLEPYPQPRAHPSSSRALLDLMGVGPTYRTLVSENLALRPCPYQSAEICLILRCLTPYLGAMLSTWGSIFITAFRSFSKLPSIGSPNCRGLYTTQQKRKSQAASSTGHLIRTAALLRISAPLITGSGRITAQSIPLLSLSVACSAYSAMSLHFSKPSM